MIYEFKSGFADRLNKFVEQKRAFGHDYESNVYYLKRFDKVCTDHFSATTELTQEVFRFFAVKKDTETTTTFRNRVSPVREFAKFLVRNGEKAYILPADFTKKSPRCLPYIYSKNEIAQIWRKFDNIPHIPYLPTRHIVLPTIIRILYCCGLRPIEACRLKKDDVDLILGRLFIRESKGHRDRIVMMPDDLTEYMRDYDRKITAVLSNREWFFTNAHDTICTTKWLDDVFDKIRNELKIHGANGQVARLYDFRHTFATHKLYEWMNNGENIYARLNYLSTYMGHAQITDTYYYIHFIPEQLQTLAGIDISRYESLLPEAQYDERYFE